MCGVRELLPEVQLLMEEIVPRPAAHGVIPGAREQEVSWEVETSVHYFGAAMGQPEPKSAVHGRCSARSGPISSNVMSQRGWRGAVFRASSVLLSAMVWQQPVACRSLLMA